MLLKQRRSLEAQISDCEARVDAHDKRLRYSAHLLKDQARSAVTGKAMLVGLAAVGGIAGLMFTRRRHRRPRTLQERWEAWEDERYERRRRRLRRARRLSLPDLLQRWGPLLLPMVSPLMNPKLTAQLAKFGLPVSVAAQRSLPTVQQLDLARYAGLWYEIARLPTRHEKRCAGDITAEYTLDEDGRLKVTNRCRLADGTLEEAQGSARVPDPAHPGQLEVSFAPAALRWFPATWADYWVLFVDEGYQVALVGTPDRDNLWLLAREPRMPTADMESLRALALRLGFDTSRLVSQPHAGAVEGDGEDPMPQGAAQAASVAAGTTQPATAKPLH
jgi:apolipoprotein D and lipocalin family protein